MFSVHAIWASVPTGFGTRTPGFGGRVKGSVGAIRKYSAGIRIMHRYPLLPPPNVVGTELMFALSSFLR